eukprot:TRINITY_DN4462_c0_g1_i1.p1 TRINITY_DN4462_c0_g1~~TRINITY_DN4462_c0_g1_i1.p1  ORF type:complete len:188 (+),score=38.49 TRINITY_DN4462_c0_g1_i1:135-698(+)
MEPSTGGGVNRPGPTPRSIPVLHKGTRLPVHKHVMKRSKLHDLVQQIDYREELNSEAEDLLLAVSDEFVDSVLDFSCKLALHRNSSRLEAKDVLFHLNKDWNIKLDHLFTPNVLAKSIITNTSGEILRPDGTVKEEFAEGSEPDFFAYSTNTTPAGNAEIYEVTNEYGKRQYTGNELNHPAKKMRGW